MDEAKHHTVRRHIVALPFFASLTAIFNICLRAHVMMNHFQPRKRILVGGAKAVETANAFFSQPNLSYLIIATRNKRLKKLSVELTPCSSGE